MVYKFSDVLPSPSPPQLNDEGWEGEFLDLSKKAQKFPIILHIVVRVILGGESAIKVRKRFASTVHFNKI